MVFAMPCYAASCTHRVQLRTILSRGDTRDVCREAQPWCVRLLCSVASHIIICLYICRFHGESRRHPERPMARSGERSYGGVSPGPAVRITLIVTLTLTPTLTLRHLQTAAVQTCIRHDDVPSSICYLQSRAHLTPRLTLNWLLACTEATFCICYPRKG